MTRQSKRLHFGDYLEPRVRYAEGLVHYVPSKPDGALGNHRSIPKDAGTRDYPSHNR